MLDSPAMWTAFAAMTPLMLYTAWNDIRTLTIPNWIPIAVTGIYVVTGIWGLPFDTFLRGLAAGVIVLAIFFAFYSFLDWLGVNSIGGGDLKLFAALVPFVFLRDTLEVMIIYTITIFVFTFAFLTVWGFRRNSTGLASIDQSGKKVLKVASPFGVALGITAIIYLGRQVGRMEGWL